MAGRKPIEANRPENVKAGLDAVAAAGLISAYGDRPEGGWFAVAGHTLVELRTPREANAFVAGASLVAPAPAAKPTPKPKAA